MIIGVDISQLAYENTGVSNYLKNLIENLIKTDKRNKYILFYSSLRKSLKPSMLDLKSVSSVQVKKFKFPPSVLDFLWNKLHIIPIEKFVGDIDIFITSDWTEPPVKKAKKATILYDFIIYKYPQETHAVTEFNFKKFLLSPNIVNIQKRKLEWVKKEADMIFCISESTRKDAEQILGLDKSKLKVIYPGL